MSKMNKKKNHAAEEQSQNVTETDMEKAAKKAEKKAKRTEKVKGMKKNFVGAFQNKAFKNGTYSTIMMVIALVVVVLVNMVVRALPVQYTAFDISGTLIYDIGDVTREAVQNLSQEVSIKVLATEESVDERINTFLEKYAALSQNITVEYVDPVKDPTILTKYDVSNSCIVVECDATGKSSIISFDDIIVSELDYYSYLYYGETSYTETEFDGEGQVTSAILAVTNPATYKVYYTQGHEENTLGDTIVSNLNKMSAVTESLNLSSTGAIPEDCDLLVINGAKKDLNGDEYKLVLDYMENGGQLMVITAYTGEEFPNLSAICSYYGIELLDGYLGDYQYKYSGGGNSSYFYLYFPINGSADSVSSLKNQYVFIEYPQPLGISSDVRSTVTVSSLLESSNYGFRYTGSSDFTYQKYYMGLEAVETVGDKESRLMVFSSETFVDEGMLSYYGSNIGNAAVFTQTVASCFENAVSVDIPAKSLEITYNTFSFQDTASIVNALFAIGFSFVLPVAIVIWGLIVWIRRRKR